MTSQTPSIPSSDADGPLRKSQALAIALFENSADCVKILDADGRLTAMNGPGMSVMDIDDFSGFEGRLWTSLWPKAARPELERALAAAKAGDVGRFYGMCPTAKGTQKWWDVHVSSVPDAHGEPGTLIAVSRDVTERSQSQDALRESEARFRNMADHAPLIMWVTEPDGYCSYLNRRWYEFTGQTEEEALGLGWTKATHPDDEKSAGDAFLAATAAQGPFRIEYRLRRADGTYRWMIDAAAPRFADDGRFLGHVGSVIDIDERREMEDALREANGLLAAVMEAVPGVVYAKDQSGRMLAANRGTEELVGKPLALILGCTDAEFLDDPDQAAAVMTNDRRVLDTALTQVLEEEVSLPDGSMAVWLSTKAPFRNAEGTVVGLVGSSVDITERRLAQEELRRLNETLERRVNAAIMDRDRTWNNSRDLLVVIGSDGLFRAVNPIWTTVLGWRVDEIVGRSYLDFIHPEDHPSSQDALKVASSENLPVYENRYRHKNGEYRWISWVAAPEGEMIYASGRDVTANKAQEAALRAAEDQLRQSQKMEAVGQLTGGIAHDFNNLLQGITGSLDLVQKRIAQGRTSELERFVSGAVTSANRAAALTHRLLAFSRRQPLDPKPIAANPLVASMEDLLRRTLGETIELELVLAGGLWPTLCDGNQLESALLNLAINARDAMPEGGKLTIETSNAHLDSAYAARAQHVSPGQYVCLSVTDSGGGMSPEVVERAFDPFFTTKAIGQGTGLGLSMIYGFARQSEGYCKIYSELGRGTTVKLYLPRHRGDAAVADPVPSLLDVEGTEHGEIVVVIEDEPVVRGLIVEVLLELGYRALEAHDGPSGLALIEATPRVDLVITDIGLPGLNGRQVVDAARVKRPDMKVLFMTGYAENAAVANGFLEPGMSMLTKPFAMEALATRIRTIIESR